ncbi:MAG TPA: SDR family oxidoreductase [Methanobacteriaceae archaeon]|nr:SDR family oxidoreductase [Methanobacteriaceae archaeon]
MKNKKVAITGGLGFIGSHLVEELSQDNGVLIIDNESSGSVENIKHLELDNISLELGDINTVDLLNLFEDVDYVFHQAAMASVPLSVDNPLLCNEINVTGTLKILDAAQKLGVKKVVFASSSAVYGDNENFPLSEVAPLNPKSPYAVSKATGELYCQVFTEVYGLPTVSLRYFNVFGPRQDPNSSYAAVIPKFISALLNSERPVIHGNGEQTRDFIYVKDVVRANLHLCESKATGVFNVASGSRISIKYLLENVQKITNRPFPPLYTEERMGDVKHSVADVSKLESTDYEISKDFEESLKATMGWFDKINK